MTKSDHVSIQFDLPEEGLRITMEGNPDKYGPAVLKVMSSDGELLRRFERRQVDLKALRESN